MQSAAQKLEKAIREGHDSVPPLLDEFAELDEHPGYAIGQALRESAPHNAQLKRRASPFDGEAAAAAISRLKACLEPVTAMQKKPFTACRKQSGER